MGRDVVRGFDAEVVAGVGDLGQAGVGQRRDHAAPAQSLAPCPGWSGRIIRRPADRRAATVSHSCELPTIPCSSTAAGASGGEAGAPVAPLLSHAEMLALDHFAHRRVHEEGPVRTTVHPPLPGGPVPGLDEHRGQTWRRPAG